MNRGNSTEMAAMRSVNAVSHDELRRRWTAARREMRSRGIDALVIQNSSDWVGGYIRWFSNQPATNGYSSTVVFPLDGGMSLIDQGPFDGCREAGEKDAFIDPQLLPSLVAHFSAALETDLAAAR